MAERSSDRGEKMDTLRAVSTADSASLLALFSFPPVYEYLCDGAAPEAAVVDAWISEALDAEAPFGLWLLEDGAQELLGCVRLSPVEDGVASVELTYVLHPAKWGRGLATSMSRSAMARAFAHDSCESIMAGADVPNERSVAVMQRLGMQLLRSVDYPAGPGVEYRLTRAEFRSMPAGPTVPFSDEER